MERNYSKRNVGNMIVIWRVTIVIGKYLPAHVARASAETTDAMTHVSVRYASTYKQKAYSNQLPTARRS